MEMCKSILLITCKPLRSPAAPSPSLTSRLTLILAELSWAVNHLTLSHSCMHMNTWRLLRSDRNVSASLLMLKHTSCLCWFWLIRLIAHTLAPWAAVTHVSPTALTFVVNRLRFWIQRVRISWTWSLPQEFWPRDTFSCDTSALCVVPSLFLLWRHQWLEQPDNNCWRMGSSEFHSR